MSNRINSYDSLKVGLMPDAGTSPRLNSIRKASTMNEQIENDILDNFETKNPQWTLLDQRRLNSLHNLHCRSREYHNNIHSFSISTDRYSVKYNVSPEVACQFYCHQKASEVMKSLQPIGYDQFDAKLSVLNAPKSGGFLWLHIDDLSCLEKIFEKFSISHIFYSYFTDLRAHSSFLESEKGFLLSVVSSHFESFSIAKMKKVFIYVANGFCLTFEHEVLSDPFEPTLSYTHSIRANNTANISTRDSLTHSPSIIANVEKALTHYQDVRYRIIEVCYSSIFYPIQ
jgi:hypothetical protein